MKRLRLFLFFFSFSSSSSSSPCSFRGIVLTLALAVGLGSRDIVSRSLERSTSFDPIPGDTDYKSSTPTDTLRHF